MKCSVCRSTKMLVRDEDRETVARDSAKAQVTDNFDLRIAEMEEAAKHDLYLSRAKPDQTPNRCSKPQLQRNKTCDLLALSPAPAPLRVKSYIH